MDSDAVIDYEAGDTPDPGSTAELVSQQGAVDPDGDIMGVPVSLIVAAPGQCDLSEGWITKNKPIGWVRALGHGITLNAVGISAFKRRASALDADGNLRPEAARAIKAAKKLGSPVVYEAIIGQHRAGLAEQLGIQEVWAFVMENVNERDCAWLYIQDARTTRPLRGYDVHRAALVRGEPRALLIDQELDERNLVLKPTASRTGQVSCIRALEKACGDKRHSVQDPDADLLAWHLDVLGIAFPGAQWNDALVQGLTFETAKRDISRANARDIGNLALKRWHGDMKVAVESVRQMRKVVTSANPQAARELWSTFFDAAKVPLKTKASPSGKRLVRKRAS